MVPLEPGSLLALTLGKELVVPWDELFVSLDTRDKHNGPLGLGSLLAATLGIDRLVPWGKALC